MAYTDPLAVETEWSHTLQQNGIEELPSPALRPAALIESIDWAYLKICSKLQARGYAQAQIDGWDMRVGYNLRLAVYWMLVKHSNLEADDLWVEKWNCLADLDTESLLIGGVIQTPTTSYGQVGYGRLDSSTDLIRRSTRRLTSW